MPAEGLAESLRSEIVSIGEYPEAQLALIDNLLIIDLLPEDAAKLAASPNVAFIERDTPIEITDTQNPTPSWGLDRIDGVFDNSFSYPANAGDGVRVYVFDTGVAGDHPDLVGRVSKGYDVIGSDQANTDCHYHGTHVASTIAGTSYGLAKKASIIPLRVLGCTGSGSTAGILRAINWVMLNHPSGTPGVANLSLGGMRNQSFNTAIAALVDKGITTVVAAGNSRADACAYSPASTPEAITVGATDRFDTRASFSNFGDCVDLFAPGVGISSANAKNYSAPVSLSGTSMASPHVAGVAALILGSSPHATTAQVESRIYEMSISGVVNNAQSSRGNRLSVSPGVNPAPIAVLPGSPTGLSVKQVGQGFVEFSWSEVPGASAYQVEFRKESQNSFTSSRTESNAFRVSGLSGGEQAYLRVSSVTDSGLTKFTAVVSGRSLIQAPSAVSALNINATAKNAAVISWNQPTSLGGAFSIQYRVEMKTTGDWQSIQTGPQRQLSISDLRIPHVFRVIAFNEAGPASPSAEVTFDPQLVYLVSGLSANLAGKSVNLSWTSDAPPQTKFEVSLIRNSQSVVERTIAVSGTQAQFDALLRLTDYRVMVTPIGQIRGIASSVAFSTSAFAPEPPRALSAVKQTSGNLLRFAAPSDNGGSTITGYRLEQLVASTWTSVQTGTSLEYAVADPARGQSQDYRLIAINAIGESAPSSTIRVTTPAQVTSAPELLQGELLADGRVRLSWQAPSDDGGAPVISYRIEVLRGATWSTWSTVSGLTALTDAVAKGTSVSYRILANNRAGASAASNIVTFERAKSVPADVTYLSSVIKDGFITFSWRATSDNGGVPLLGYRLQIKQATQWTDASEVISALTAQVTLGNPGETKTYRVVALNELGASTGGQERSVQMPFMAASAPKEFTVNLESNRIRFDWLAPDTTGGSSVTGYIVSVSSDGVSYRSVLSARSNQLSAFLTQMPRGQKVYYRIQAQTSGFATGLPSQPVEVSVPAVAPVDPQNLTARLVSNEGIVLTWLPPTSDGGSPVSVFRVEVNNGSAWQTIGSTDKLTFTAPMGKAGELLRHRVLAVNEVGASLGSRIVQTQMGISPATPVRTVSASLVSGRLLLQWQAPEIMGGRFSYYEVHQLTSNGFVRVATTSSSSASVVPPVPGASSTYRVAAVTNAGLGSWSDLFTYLAPKVVPAAPTSLVMRSSGLVNIATWSTTGLNAGGGTLDKAILYVDRSGVWERIAEVPVSAGTLTFANADFGQTLRYSLAFTNEIGTSPLSRVATLRHSFAVTSQVRDLVGQVEGSALRLSWKSPDFVGGAAPSGIEVQGSADGITWRRLTSTRYTESILVSPPAKGATQYYRVLSLNQAGSSQPSEFFKFDNPRTAPGASFSVSASRSGGSVAFRVTAPSDFGGYAEVSARIELVGTLAFESSDEVVLTRPGVSTVILQPLPTNRGTFTYRVVIANPSGEVDRTVTFRY
jgi:subtilisin family serine protease